MRAPDYGINFSDEIILCISMGFPPLPSCVPRSFQVFITLLSGGVNSLHTPHLFVLRLLLLSLLGCIPPVSTCISPPNLLIPVAEALTCSYWCCGRKFSGKSNTAYF